MPRFLVKRVIVNARSWFAPDEMTPSSPTMPKRSLSTRFESWGMVNFGWKCIPGI
jgi:hypothetical protein